MRNNPGTYEPHYVVSGDRVYRIDRGGIVSDIGPREDLLSAPTATASESPTEEVTPEVESPDDVDNPDPSFIQLAAGKPLSPRVESHQLKAQLVLPGEASLVRGSVPVFGIAAGENFLAYELQYGEGTSPETWRVVASSMADHTAVTIPSDLSGEAGEVTLHGNLGNWDVGLREYVYMPDYPPDHPVNLAGLYTLRLVVFGKDGSWIEDRRTVEVGGVVPNAWGARVLSDDANARLDVPEQAIREAFRLISIRRVEAAIAQLPVGAELVQGPYVFREPGERFTKPARLVITSDFVSAPQNSGLYRLDAATGAWLLLPSKWDASGSSLEYSADLHALPGAGESIALLSAGSAISSAVVHTPEVGPARGALYAVHDTFDTSIGNWTNRDGDVGGVVSVDPAPALDGSPSLRVTTVGGGGNFAVTAFSQRFDVREFPSLSFDYRVGPGVKTDLYAKVAGRWYNISFTDDPQAFPYRRVNIANVGRVPNVVADNTWQHAEVNLAAMLATRTGNTTVDELVFADWDVNGYMRLDYGHNLPGATYYIDNFTIARGEAALKPAAAADPLVVDTFSGSPYANNLGLEHGTFIEGRAQLEQSIESCNGNPCLHLTFGGRIGDLFTYAGWNTEVGGLDIRSYESLELKLGGQTGGELVNIYLDDGTTRVYVDAEDYGSLSRAQGVVRVPLVRFAEQGLDLSHVEGIQLVLEWEPMSGEILVDDVLFRKTAKEGDE